ncbi:MAG: hypothetical protein ACYCSX_00320 [Acidimicrobiales bacterium]
MPEGVRDEGRDIEREIQMIRDPELRAVRAVEAHRRARDLAVRLSSVRRDALVGLHDAGRTWQEVADAVGMSLKATNKAVHGAGEPAHWWKRLPPDVAESVKRGPGGRERTRVVPRATLMDVIVETMSETERASRSLGRGAARVTPGELLEHASSHLGKPVSRPSLRAALYSLIEDGRVARVGHGRYVLTHPPAPARRAPRKPRPSTRPSKKLASG